MHHFRYVHYHPRCPETCNHRQRKIATDQQVYRSRRTAAISPVRRRWGRLADGGSQTFRLDGARRQARPPLRRTKIPHGQASASAGTAILTPYCGLSTAKLRFRWRCASVRHRTPASRARGPRLDLDPANRPCSALSATPKCHSEPQERRYQSNLWTFRFGDRAARSLPSATAWAMSASVRMPFGWPVCASRTMRAVALACFIG